MATAEVALAYSSGLAAVMATAVGAPCRVTSVLFRDHSWRGPTSKLLLQLVQQMCKHQIAFIKSLPVYNLQRGSHFLLQALMGDQGTIRHPIRETQACSERPMSGPLHPLSPLLRVNFLPFFTCCSASQNSLPANTHLDPTAHLTCDLLYGKVSFSKLLPPYPPTPSPTLGKDNYSFPPLSHFLGNFVITLSTLNTLIVCSRACS